MISYLIRARWFHFALVLLVFISLSAAGKKVRYEQSIHSFFSASDPDIINYRKASEAFGNDNVVFICYDDPELLSPAGMDRIRELAQAVGPKAIPGILDVQSLESTPVLWQVDEGLASMSRLPKFLRDRAIKTLKASVGAMGSSGAFTIGAAIRSAAPKPLADLKQRILAHPLLAGTLVDAKGKTAAVVARLRKTDEFDMKSTVKQLREVADAFGSRHGLGKPAVVGPPVLLADGYANIELDGRRLAILGMALIGLVTFIATRSVWWALAPILAGWVVWLATEWLLAKLGLKLSLSGGPVVAQVIVLTMPAASHLAIHFREDSRRLGATVAAARSTLEAVSVPILWCAATGALGYGVLLTSSLVPVRQFGAILGGCTLLAALLTMVLAPFAMLPPFRLGLSNLGKPRTEPRPDAAVSPEAAQGSMNRLTDWVTRHAGAVVLGVLLIALPAALGVPKLEYESNYINIFRKNARVLKDYHFVESRLGGIGLFVLGVPLKGGLNPKNLEKLEQFQAKLAESAKADPALQFTSVLSASTVLDPDKKLAKETPERRSEMLSAKLDLISGSSQADLMKGFWNSKLGMARIMIRIPEQQFAHHKEAEFRTALVSARELFGPESYLTGLSFLMMRTARSVVSTQWSTTTASVLGIVLMLALALRDPRLALLAMLPSLLAIVFVLGLMGWTGIKLDIATALVASVALGLSVDDTFHCLLQFKRQRRTCSFEESLRSSYESTGPGVLLSSLAVAAGFAVLWLSEFVPFSNFGLMVCIATAGSSLGNLVLLPACLVVGERLRKIQSSETSQSEPAAALGELTTKS